MIGGKVAIDVGRSNAFGKWESVNFALQHVAFAYAKTHGSHSGSGLQK